MTGLEITLALAVIVLVVVATIAFRMLVDARVAQATAEDVAATACQALERGTAAAAAKVDAAERHARIVEGAWNRSVDALRRAQRPAPVSYGGSARTPRLNAQQSMELVAEAAAKVARIHG